MAVLLFTACDSGNMEITIPDLVWGRHGVGEGRFQRPRAIAIDDENQVYIVDKKARVQVFTSEGNYIKEWTTPISDTGKPTGISIGIDGNVLVADTHYYRVLIYSPDGELLRKIGGDLGSEPGQFEYVTDVVQDSLGNFYISQYGEHDFIQKYSPEGEFLTRWGGHGHNPGQVLRPQCLLMDRKNQLWVADAGNDRIQVFDTHGNLIRVWGESGDQPGQLSYPHGLDFDSQGNILVCERRNSRIQKFTPTGQSLGCWGRPGRDLGEVWHPWSLAVNRMDCVFVLDTYNHRVQRLIF